MLALLATAALAQDAAPPVVTVVRPDAPADTTVPLRLAVVPGVGLGADPQARVEGASLGLWSQGESLEGVDAELILSWTTGAVEGVQGSVVANYAGELEGGQLSAGVNIARGDVDGMQGSPGLNIAGGRLRGFQGTAGVNIAAGAGSEGVQASAGLNVARDLEGVQAAPMNVADHVDGVQAGLLNIGRDVQGLQLGLVNVAKTSDVSIAPINLIGDGLHRVDVWTSESALASAAVKFGSRQVYTLLGVGWLNTTQPWWTFGGGLGVHLGLDPFWLELDDSAWALATGNAIAPGVHNKLRAQVGFDLVHQHLAPFVGVSVNTWVGTGDVWPRAVDLPSHVQDHHRVVTWPGVHAGVSF